MIKSNLFVICINYLWGNCIDKSQINGYLFCFIFRAISIHKPLKSSFWGVGDFNSGRFLRYLFTFFSTKTLQPMSKLAVLLAVGSFLWWLKSIIR